MKRSGMVLAGIVVVGVCAASAPAVLDRGSVLVPPVATASGPVELVAYDSCDEVLSQFRAAERPHLTEYGRGAYATDEGGVVMNSEAGVAADSRQKAAPAAPPQADTPDHSTTNAQEAGVDEPDLVKTDGKRIITVVDGTLRVVDVASRAVTGSLELPGAAISQLLLSGDRALVVTTSLAVLEKPLAPNEFAPTGGASLVLVDLSGAPKEIGTLSVDGAYVDARQIGGVARVVVSSWPRLNYVYPDGVRTTAQALRENERILQDAPVSAWLPRYELTTPTSRADGTLVDCSRVSFPRQPTASSLLTVLTFDLAAALGTGDPVSIVASGDTVYGSEKNLYVADQRQVFQARGKVAPNPSTAIHQFDISQPGPPKHVASGVVNGIPLNQYSFSEHAGHLRVATTTSSGRAKSQSSVTVLRREGDTLVRTGQVDGLGVGERIYSVRFLGDVGYVVTFRQTDPLYTLDLADPAKPQVVGELKINGYSAYLHPAGDGRLIGVGQDATDRGRVTGTQVSLFDVSEPAKPVRLAQYHLPGASSEVEYDAHAFLYWSPTGLLVLPLADRAGVDGGGSLMLRLSDNGFSDLGTVKHPTGVVRRSLVIGDDLWTVSDAGLMATSADRAAQLAWVPFR
ncbi:beta-propeller domain-containing protein [Umezawaea endophytica]|uniref:Beta-propeller domain-containing protein n=1 Tax=Umezawaea endophytica TaxID=1654476 RepID=A0A9X2VL93_9PSEU|nr:beta-propeller domain-containing protein [Umezawaea endophytica]MCS7478102.1 beta-propeller domain-containing protein [Umezawaea endophytica]